MKSKLKRPWNPATFPSFWINHASRLLMRRFEEVLRPLGFGMAYFPVVMALREDEGEGLLQRDLAVRAHVEQPTMAALLGRMERDGLIARAPHPSDKRSSLVSLTRKARARVPAAEERLFEVAEAGLEGFSPEEREAFLEMLQRFVSNLGSAEVES